MRKLENIVGYPDEINNLIQTVSHSLVEYANECIPDWDFSNYYSIHDDGKVLLVFIRKKKEITLSEKNGNVTFTTIPPVRFSIEIPSPIGSNNNYRNITLRRTIHGEYVETILDIAELDEIVNQGIYWLMGLVSDFRDYNYE